MKLLARGCSPAVAGLQERIPDRRFVTVSAAIFSAAVRYWCASTGGVCCSAALFRNGYSAVVSSAAKSRLRPDMSPSRSETVFRYSALVRRRRGVRSMSVALPLQVTGELTVETPSEPTGGPPLEAPVLLVGEGAPICPVQASVSE